MLFLILILIHQYLFDYEVDTSIYRGTLSINFGWFAKFKPLTDLFITGFVYLFLLGVYFLNCLVS